MHTTSIGLQTLAEEGVPTSFCVLGCGDEVHGVSLALMACLRNQAYRVTGLLPLASDAQWRHGLWRSERVKQIQTVSSFAFPASALCAVVPPEHSQGDSPGLDIERVVDSYAVLSSWVDLVVVDALGEPDGVMVPNIGDAAKALGLPVVIACLDDEQAIAQACALVASLRARKLRVVAWVQVGEQPVACAAGMACVGAIPADVLSEPAQAARHIDVTTLLSAIRAQQGPQRREA